MGILYVAGQRPGAGSTAVCAALAMVWRKAGHRVALVKPASLGAGGAADAELFAALNGDGTAHGQVPLVATGPTLEREPADAIAQSVEALGRTADVVVVEGLPLSDGQGTPITASHLLAQRLDAQVLGVLPYTPDVSMETAARWREAFGAALAGVVINRRTLYAGHDAQARLVPELQGAGVPVLGVVPEERLLLAPTVHQVGDHLQAQFYVGSAEDQRLVEHFLIGGLILESGINYFNRFPNQAVIVRGTRPDIAMAALSSPLSCLVLTGGTEPTQYLYHQAKAEEVPLMVVEMDTPATAEALDSVQERVSVHHPQKVERFAALLEELLDWGALQAAAGLG